MHTKDLGLTSLPKGGEARRQNNAPHIAHKPYQQEQSVITYVCDSCCISAHAISVTAISAKLHSLHSYTLRSPYYALHTVPTLITISSPYLPYTCGLPSHSPPFTHFTSPYHSHFMPLLPRT